MLYSQNGLQLTESFESFESAAYWDTFGKVWTIGYGHTGKEVVQGLVWTKQQAITALAADVSWASACVNHLVKVNLDQAQFDALVDFTFNTGVGNFTSSTLLKCINAENMAEADVEFSKWIYSGGRVLSGLVRRRLAEAMLFKQ